MWLFLIVHINCFLFWTPWISQQHLFLPSGHHQLCMIFPPKRPGRTLSHCWKNKEIKEFTQRTSWCPTILSRWKCSKVWYYAKRKKMPNRTKSVHSHLPDRVRIIMLNRIFYQELFQCIALQQWLCSRHRQKRNGCIAETVRGFQRMATGHLSSSTFPVLITSTLQSQSTFATDID